MILYLALLLLVIIIIWSVYTPSEEKFQQPIEEPEKKLVEYSIDPEDTGIEEKLWGPLYPNPIKYNHLIMKGIPNNMPPLSLE